MKMFAGMAALMVLALCQAASAQPSVSAGHRLARADCAMCHAVDRGDQSPNPHAPRFRDLGPRYPFDGLRDALVKGMIIGHPQLMPRQALAAPDIDHLIDYMKTLQRSPQREGQGGLRPLG